ncbi:hypothetical protein ABPG72_007892 [Tetrahymena utriculariae]
MSINSNSNKQNTKFSKVDGYYDIYREVNKNLYEKYSSSQNYYYTREVNEILFRQENTRSWIRYKDFCQFDDDTEQYFQEFYKIALYDKKITYLTEYYKFHNDIPRMFMEPLCHIMNYYHDKQRKIKYVKITRMLQMQQQQQQQKNQQNLNQQQLENGNAEDKLQT